MNEETDRLLERLLEAPPGPQREQILARIDANRREEALKLLDAGDLVWEAAHSAPPLEKDPVAAMLGVVPDPNFQLDAKALARACKTSRVKPTALASRLNARGWKIDASDVFRWQTRPAPDVPPALIKAIAEEVHSEPERLVARSQPQRTALVEVAENIAASPRFRDLVQRFATIRQISVEMAESAMKSRMLATVHRGDMPDQEQMLASLESLVHALETEQDR
ncbi:MULTISPECIES: hypothetical protein [unclassified Arthrobacter]|uniref:hypothetical protein n=1 Tax=unclassified Arthrobacter TaxID=235627 RepID=UPI001C8586D6|nr:hypothetical protein [Arthrobacter sp. MAHUQ-56]MBX7446000.1 hypothetical protein [Arthrobacter sp. MAHUQ-56]